MCVCICISGSGENRRKRSNNTGCILVLTAFELGILWQDFNFFNATSRPPTPHLVIFCSKCFFGRLEMIIKHWILKLNVKIALNNFSTQYICCPGNLRLPVVKNLNKPCRLTEKGYCNISLKIIYTCFPQGNLFYKNNIVSEYKYLSK